MKKTNQEIINAIADASESSYIDNGKEDTIRFCLYISEDDKATTANGLREAGLTAKHLTQLSKEGIIVEHHIDDYCLHIRIKDSFLTNEQRAYAEGEREKDLALEEHHKELEKEKKHADKCVAMHDKLVKALSEARKYFPLNSLRSDNYNADQHFLATEIQELLKQAEQK